MLGVATILAVVILSTTLGSPVGEALTRNTVRLALAWYAVSLLVLLRLTPDDWAMQTLRGRVARWCWTVGCISFVVHVAIAFHFYHDWSHAHAFERTREDSGIGEGIYLSYVFTGLWIADVAWWWARPQQYAARSPWIDRSLHVFMLFMVFNSMVVFETGATRWAGLLMFVVLSVAWLLARGWPRRRPA